VTTDDGDDDYSDSDEDDTKAIMKETDVQDDDHG
jgi:hypothetical protein